MSRLMLLTRQTLAYNYRMILISVGGFCGGLFIIFLFIQLGHDFQPIDEETVMGTFLGILIPLGIIYGGMAFPGLRSKEQAYSYLLNPASVTEKFVFEFFSRIILYILIAPVLFMIIYYLENYMIQLFYGDYVFWSFTIGDMFKGMDVESREMIGWGITLATSMGLLIFIVPFTGSTFFMKYPLIKTLAATAVVIFFHVMLVFFFMEGLGFKHYAGNNKTILFISDEGDLLKFMTIYSLIGNLALLATAFFKLKEKEV